VVVLIAWIALIGAIVYVLVSSVKRVPAGERLVVYRLGRVHVEVDGPATVLTIPFVDRAARLPAGTDPAHRIEP
jgi:regulator of protease activity HflC (stomatin/prohibitin superfamily)